MILQIEERVTEGVVILDLKGPLTAGLSDAALREKLRALCLAGQIKIILNLKDVSNIDSSGLGVLVFGLAKLRRVAGDLALLHLNAAHLGLFSLTKLAVAFELFDDEQHAVNSFFPGRGPQPYDILTFAQESAAEHAAELIRHPLI